MALQMEIRKFTEADAAQVRRLFVHVNRLLAPRHMKTAFECYISRSLGEEIDRIPDYYAERNGSFWVAVKGVVLAGMFGLESISDEAFELRRMYVDPDFRRQGIARAMLEFAENECRRRGRQKMLLSTSELQPEAISLYRQTGYVLKRVEVSTAATNKTLGCGIQRSYFEKILQQRSSIPKA